MEQHFFFQLLKNIISNAFQVETFYLKPPYTNITTVPLEVLNTIFPNNLYNDERIFPSEKTPNRRLFVIKTSLAFYNIHFCLNSNKKCDIISIGPFRTDNISLEEFIKELDNIPFLASKHSFFLNYYQSLPCVSLQNIINTVCYLINTCMLLPETISPIYVDFTSINNGLFDTETITNKDTVLTHKYAETVRERLLALLNTVEKGNPEAAQQEMNLLLTNTGILTYKNFSKCKGRLHAVNSALQTNVLFSHIQPLEAQNLYLTFVNKIDNSQTRDTLLKTAYDMCYAYCSLFQNNTFPEYSKTVSDVINYIYTHLAEPLSLSVIADYFHRNASRLSTDFKQETGQTITNFIQQTRINRAINYLCNTELSVSEAALATGFDDFAYFSRVFKKHTGYSPKEYRDLHTKKEEML